MSSFDHYLDMLILDHDSPVMDYDPEHEDPQCQSIHGECGETSNLELCDCDELMCHEHRSLCAEFDCAKTLCAACSFPGDDQQERCYEHHKLAHPGIEDKDLRRHMVAA